MTLQHTEGGNHVGGPQSTSVLDLGCLQGNAFGDSLPYVDCLLLGIGLLKHSVLVYPVHEITLAALRHSPSPITVQAQDD